MDIQEVISHKHKLEKDIRRLISDYEAATSTLVLNVSPVHVRDDTLGGHIEFLSYVIVEIKI